MYQVQCIKHTFLETVPFQLNTMIQMMFPSIPRMILNKSDTSSSNSNLHPFKLNFEIESRKPAAEIMQLSHCFEGRLHVQPRDFWKGLNNEIEVQFDTVPGDTTSHECSATLLGDLNCCTAIYCFIATSYCILGTNWAAVMLLKYFVLVLPIVWVKNVDYLDEYNTLHFCLHLQVEAKVM